MPIQFGFDLLGDVQGVQYRFASKAKAQEGWRVQTVVLKERISGLYSLHVALSAEYPGPNAVGMLGEDASIEITRDGVTRVVHGIVESVCDGAWSRHSTLTQLVIVPALAALAHSSNSRIFSDMTAPAIVAEVLKGGLTPLGRKLAPPTLSRTDYPIREYVVQHRETDLAFVMRLLAEEGIWFYFAHPSDDEVESLFLRDTNEDALPVAESAEVDFSPDRETNAQHPVITVFGGTARMGTTEMRVRQHNWSHPGLELEGKEAIKEPAPFESNRPLLRYEHGDVSVYDYKEPMYTQHDTAMQARQRFQLYRIERQMIAGESNVLDLRAGHFMEVQGQEYLLIEVTHTGASTAGSGQAARHGTYTNSFVCVRRDVPYRPVRQDKRRIDGIQAATVVDRSGKLTAPRSSDQGEDVVTDVHGRVRVKFPWDTTKAEKAGTTSCWLRVAQMWAGAGWGTQFIPRVGMEVTVQFVDGDPDQPVVTGCLYNGLNAPPYAKTPTQSGIKTASSVDPTRYNELRFEDANNQEQIFVRAQKDYEELIFNNHKTTVHANQTQVVDKNQSETVSGSASLTVAGSRSKGVGGTESIKVKGPRTTTVVKKNTEIFEDEYEQTVTAAVNITHNATRTTTVKKDDIETITDGSKATSVIAGSYEVRSSKALTLVQDGKHALQLDGKAHLQTSSDFSVTNGKCQVESKGGELHLTASSAITLGSGQAKIELKSDGTINITGTKIGVTAGNNSVVADSTGVTISGVKVSSTAVGIHEIQGAMIRIG